MIVVGGSDRFAWKVKVTVSGCEWGAENLSGLQVDVLKR